MPSVARAFRSALALLRVRLRRSLRPIGDEILFVLDDQLMPRVRDAAYGYALNSVPLGNRTYAPE